MTSIARNIFLVLAALNSLIAFALGIAVLVNPQSVFEAFGIPYTSALDSIVITTGGLFILVGVLQVIAIVWTLQGKVEGIIVISCYAVFLFMLGVVDFVRLEQTDILLVDSIRGFLTMVAGVFAYRELKK